MCLCAHDPGLAHIHYPRVLAPVSPSWPPQMANELEAPERRYLVNVRRATIAAQSIPPAFLHRLPEATMLAALAAEGAGEAPLTYWEVFLLVAFAYFIPGYPGYNQGRIAEMSEQRAGDHAAAERAGADIAARATAAAKGAAAAAEAP